MVCAFTKLIKGVLIKDKKAQTIMDGVYRGWCLTYGLQSVGFSSDNGGDIRNHKMEEFVDKKGIKI